MIDFIIAAILICIAGGVIFYLYRQKKRGASCIGCPYAQQCASRHGKQCGGTHKNGHNPGQDS